MSASSDRSRVARRARLVAAGALALVAAILLVSSWAVERRRARRARAASIELRWVRAYPAESWDQVRTGIAWSLSFLGAKLPTGSLDRVVRRHDESHFRLELAPAAFTPRALDELGTTIQRLKDTDEYRQQGSLDLGRFLALGVYGAWQYYRVTGAEPTYAALADAYGISAFDTFPLVHSYVAKNERRLRVRPCAPGRPIVFVAEEGTGATARGDFHTETYETLVVQPNGQLRFAIYDRDGALAAASPHHLGDAGKPAKCLWCHEINLLPLFVPSPPVPGFMSPDRFGALIEGCRRELGARRKALSSDIDFGRTQDHAQSELLYITFMEPSAMRVTNDWRQEPGAVRRTLADLPEHDYTEYPFLGRLYHRADIDARAPYDSLAPADSLREPSAYEPDLARGAFRSTRSRPR